MKPRCVLVYMFVVKICGHVANHVKLTAAIHVSAVGTEFQCVDCDVLVPQLRKHLYLLLLVSFSV